LYVVNVVINGEGVPLKLELERPENQLVNFGALRVRQHVTRHVKLVNRSKRAVAFMLEDKGRRMEEVAVTIGGAGREVHLRPRESYTIDMEFQPMHRLTQFSEELWIRVASGSGVNGASGGVGMTPLSLSRKTAPRPLLTVTGACQGAEVTIESDSLTFGSVCEGCFYTRSLQIQNAGDVGTAFRWDASRTLGAHFSISPKDGFLPPHSQLMFDVTFKPMVLSEDLRCDALCMVEGGASLPLSLSGACMSQPSEGVKELTFETKVRVPQTKQITLNNPTRSTWFLQPTIHNDYWKGPERIEVPPIGSASYDLTFCPLTMTKLAATTSTTTTSTDDGNDADAAGQSVGRPESHQGSVFFALPNGTSEMYTVLGTASEPDVVDTLTATTKAKETLAINLPVKNWLKVAQRFDVDINMDSSTAAGDAKYHFAFTGHNALDVPGRSARDYKLSFTGYVEGKSRATVRFTNAATGEYLWYIVEAESTAAGVVGVVEVRAPVRQVAKRIIEINNPLPPHVQVTFPETWWRCDSSCVRVLKLTDDLTGKKTGKFQVQYRPLVPTVPEAGRATSSSSSSTGAGDCEEHKLTIICDQLGEFNYTLRLEAVAVGVDKTLHFNTSLGATQEKAFRFTHFVKSGAVEFSCRVGQRMFFVVPDKVKSAPTQEWGGQEVEIPVRFEPQALGEVRDELVVTSTVPGGGEYRCALKSTCDAPRPKGPVFLEPGKEQTINFRNVFGEKREFRFTVDSPNFVVGKPVQVIESQKSATVGIKYVPQESKTGGSAGPAMGKLLVDCPEMTGLPPWVYYLRGEKPSS
jgi:hydrocephalus-inducing protein